MKAMKFWAASAVAAAALSASAELEITEICARCQPNVPACKDLGWVELYNNGTAAVNLSDYKLVRANRGKAPAPAKISALLDRTVEPGAYTLVYTSEMFENGVAATTVENYTYGTYGDIMVLPQKINQKKYPLVQLLKKGADETFATIQSVVVPVDLADNLSYTTVGGSRAILPTPTPGAANNLTGAAAYGPNISPLYGVAGAADPWKAYPMAEIGVDYTVSFPVNPIDLSTAAGDAIAQVKLIYSVGNGKDTPVTGEVTMTRAEATDAVNGDVYTGTIPGSAFTTAGHRVLFAAKITDGANREWRSPSFKNPDDGYEWYGTIVRPTTDLLSERLQTLHLFVEGNNIAQMDVDVDSQNLSLVPYNARCGIYDSVTGFYYDNVRIDLRGNTSGQFKKKAHGLKFNKSQPFSCTDPVTGTVLKEIRKSSFTAEFADPSFLRQHLAFKIFNENGSPAPFHYPVRLNRNGSFYQLAFHTERFTDELIEDCYGLDPLGYAYKNVGNFNDTSTNAGKIEKKTPDDENESDLSQLTAFCNQIKTAASVSYNTDFSVNKTFSADLTKVVVEKFDLPAWINYLALARITHENDDVWANLSAYYDVNGQGTWRPLAYDMNLSFGQYYNDVSGMSGTTAADDAFKSHPFYGGYHVQVNALKGQSSRCCRAVEAVWQSEKFRNLYLRRLRTLMDKVLKEPGTSEADTPFWQYAASITNAIAADAVLDRAATPIDGTCAKIWIWGSSNYGMTVADGTKDIWENYVEKRRTHLYDTHSVTNTAKAIGYGSDFNAGIPLAQSALASLTNGFSIVGLAEDGSFTATDKIVIANDNDEAVDLSGWRMTGAVTYTFPAGAVVDAHDSVTVVADRKAYVAANGATLSDEVLLGNAVFAGEGKVNLLTADDETVIQGDPVEATSYDGVYTEPVVINKSGEYVFSNAVFQAGLTFGDGTYTVKRQKDLTSTVGTLTCAGDLTFTGKGTLQVTEAMSVSNLTITAGTLAATGSAAEGVTNKVVTVKGSFLLDGGAVELSASGAGTVYGIFLASKNQTATLASGSLTATVDGMKSAALRVDKGSSKTYITGGTITGSLAGNGTRFIDTDGTLDISGTPAIAITSGDAPAATGLSLLAAAAPATDARAIKANKTLTISDGTVVVSVPGAGSEALSSDQDIVISGGTVDLTAADDCISAGSNVTISNGLIYCHSTGNDAVDANGNITIDGGLVLAYTTAVEEDGNGSYGLDVNNTAETPHAITINGGSVVALSGPGATYAQPSGTQPAVVLNDVAGADYSGKYISLTSTADGTNVTSTVKLPAIETSRLSLLATVPGLAEDAELAVSETEPTEGALGFHDAYQTFSEAEESGPGTDPEDPDDPEPEVPVAGDPNVSWNTDGEMFVYDSFGRALKITVDYEPAEPLTNFPVLVRLAANSPAGFSYADFYSASGADLVFVDDAGNVIPHEIDTWNTAGQSLVWVKVPVVTNNTTFTMCYRSAKDGSTLTSAGVWDDYTGVWHLGETGSGFQNIQDSTANDLDMVSHDNSSAEANGPVGGARRISTKTGASDANGRVFLDLSQDAGKKAAVDRLGDTFVASFWTKLAGNCDWSYLIGRKSADSDAGWAMQFNHASDSKQIRVWTRGTKDTEVVKLTDVNPLANVKTAWIKVDLVYDGTTYSIYCDGTQTKTGNTHNYTTAVQDGDFAFGGCAGSGYGSVNGWMDEVRLRKGAPSAAWIAADYATQKNADFLAAGDVIEIAEKPIPVVAMSLVDSGAKYAQFEALAGNFGGEATSCGVQYKLWKSVESEPAEWTVLMPALTLNEAVRTTVTGLDPETAYSYKMKGANGLANGETEVVEGAFTTGGTGAPGAGGDRYRVQNDYVHKYIIGTEDLTFVPPAYATSVTAMLVAGGGAGGYRQGGGGGAGGLLYTTLPVTPGETYTVRIGTGGVASTSADVRGGNGGDSTIAHGADVLLTAIGGGVGGNYKATPEDWTLTVGGNGGSGGGNGYFNKDSSLGSTYAAAYNKHVGTGTADQGFDGGAANVGSKGVTGQNLDSGCKSAGGGGGAGKVGGSASEDNPCGAGSGGAGKAYDISGKTVYYAGGGAGGTAKVSGNSNVNTVASGGTGGGGDGGWSTTLPTAGADGFGGGGGGGSGDEGYYQGANGGSGCVYIRYTVKGNGAGSATPVASLTAAELTAVMTAKVDYRVAWAGEGNETCDVYAAYGTSPNALNGEALLASGVIGTGTGSFSLPAPNTLYYVRIRVKNAAGQSDSDDLYTLTTGELSETVSTVLTVTESSVSEGNYNATLASTAAGTVYRLTGNTYFGDTTEGWTMTEVGAIAAGGTLEDVAPLTGVMYLRYALDKGNGAYEYTATVMVTALDTPALGAVTLTENAGESVTLSGTVTSLGLATEGTVRCWIGVQEDITKMKAQDPMTVSEGAYTLSVTNLTALTTYYYYVEVVNANGSASSSAVGTFTTVEVVRGPTDAEGNLVGEIVDGVAVIDVSLAGAGTLINIPNGVTEVKLGVMIGEASVDMTSYYTAASLTVADGTITPALDASLLAPVFTESAIGAGDAIQVTDAAVLLTATAKPGLYYTLVKSATVDGAYTAVAGQKVQAGAAATTVSFTAAKAEGEAAAFFKVEVSDR